MKHIFLYTILAVMLALGTNNAYAGKPDKGDKGGKPGGGGGKGGGDKVAMCVDGVSVMVPPKKVDSYLANGARLLEPGDCCTNWPTTDYPDGIYDRWEWDWYTCDWISVKHCEPEGPNPSTSEPYYECHWCIFSCDWSCNTNPNCRWIQPQEQMHVCGWSCW